MSDFKSATPPCYVLGLGEGAKRLRLAGGGGGWGEEGNLYYSCILGPSYPKFF